MAYRETTKVVIAARSSKHTPVRSESTVGSFLLGKLFDGAW